jgi:hypothetical protein
MIFIKEKALLFLGLIAGILIGFVSFTLVNKQAEEIISAAITGAFNMIAATVAIFVAYMAYISAHIPFERRAVQSASLIKAYVNSYADVIVKRDRACSSHSNNIQFYKFAIQDLGNLDFDIFNYEFLKDLPYEKLCVIFSIQEQYRWLRSVREIVEEENSNLSDEEIKKLFEDCKKNAFRVY